MKKTIISIIVASLLASAASAQIIYNVTGSTGVKAQFTFNIDDSANTVTVDVNNNIAGIGGAKGVVMGFGFDTPFTDAELGTDGSNTSITTQKLDGTTDLTWLPSDPWSVSPSQYTMEYGVAVADNPEGGNANEGIAWGSSAHFVLQFPDFSGDDGWLSKLAVRFQSITNSQNQNTSDKVLGIVDDGGGPGEGFVPEPSTYGMFGALALLGLMVVRNFRRR